MKTLTGLAIAILLFLPGALFAQTLYEFFPAQINPNEKYVFYSHGFIVEGNNPTPTHNEYGTYQFPAIKQALFAIGGFNLIAHHRPEGTPVEDYAQRLASWVNRLLDAGVDAKNITLVGFSRGGRLTALASDLLANAGINTAIMASCLNDDIEVEPPLVLGGRFLSIYELTDGPGSCKDLAARSDLAKFDEIEINTGKSHGAFYSPLADWMRPLAHWLQQAR